MNNQNKKVLPKGKGASTRAAKSYEEICKHGVHYGGQDCFACHPNHPAIQTLGYLLGSTHKLNSSPVASERRLS